MSPMPTLATVAAAGSGLPPGGFEEIARRLPSMRVPVRIVYGERDRILPDIAATVARLSEDLPHAEVTPLPECGHFLQEETPAEVGELLASFFSAPGSPQQEPVLSRDRCHGRVQTSGTTALIASNLP